jgi:uncharacterized membrane protein YgdD (TMEM256/DUF423 family)
MAQQINSYSETTTIVAKNLRVNSGSTETIMLDHVPGIGSRNWAVTIVNYSGSITAVALYGSPDGVNYVAISGFSTFTVGALAVGHGEATTQWPYIRVTTTGVALIDIYATAT